FSLAVNLKSSIVNRQSETILGLFDLPAEVIASDLYHLAHLEKPRAQPNSDAVCQHLLSNFDPVRQRLLSVAHGLIDIVRGKNRQLLVVVAAVNDVRDRVSHPFGRLCWSQFLSHKGPG